MNCQEFENVVTDLARVSMMDAAAREDGLGHAAGCARCAARLADEQTLTDGLCAAAAVSADTDYAPAHLEATLRAAFGARVEVLSPVAHAFAPRGSRSMVVGAVAAVFAALVTLVGWNVLRSSQAPPLKPVAQTPSATGSAPSKNSIENKEAVALKEVAGEKGGGHGDGVAKNDISAPRALSSARSNLKTIAAGRYQRLARGGLASGSPRGEAVEDTSASPRFVSTGADEDSIATEFMPLTQGGELSNADGGQIVRVEMPRSALVSFGLPMNMERARERVKADVVLGHDGVARAIRFVH
ncbi:MAG: hypothetical protein H0W76_25920 [Pyrinomonadaceae bacterium]|nr:hypothetical protein [Pyrinomonadaceae bacterium]